VSIVAYTGLPGSGKSYGVVEHQIIPALIAGRKVVTNIPLHFEAVQAFLAEKEVEFLRENVVEFPIDTVAPEPHRIYDFVTPGCVFVLDEVWKLFPQGLTGNKVPAEYGKLLAEHRHMVDASGNSTQIVFVVQDLANIAAFARRLVENTFVSTKLSHMGTSKAYRIDIYHGAVTGATPPVSNRLRFIAGRYKKEIYALYKSQTMSDAKEHGNEAKVDGRANIFKRPIVIAAIVFIPLSIGWGLWRFNAAWHEMGKGKGLVTNKAVESQGSAQRSSAEPAPLTARVRELLPSPPRLLAVVAGMGPSPLTGIIAADGRIYEVRAKDCAMEKRLRGVAWRCKWNGAWYDGAGVVGGFSG
jgi:zona occludens toxin